LISFQRSGIIAFLFPCGEFVRKQPVSPGR
jgi:hypothetical protein